MIHTIYYVDIESLFNNGLKILPDFGAGFMNIYLRKLIELLGMRVKSIFNIPRDIVGFIMDGIKLMSKKRSDFPIAGIIPIIGDNHAAAGGIDSHYFLQDIYMAKKILENNPQDHYDIGSRVDGFISHLLCNNIHITMIDIRPLPRKVEGLSFLQGDATNLSRIETESIDSLSSLHAVEHFGLSRYGGDIDTDASMKAMKEMMRVIKKGGYLYFSVPISYKNGIYYNSHRVFKPSYIRCIWRPTSAGFAELNGRDAEQAATLQF